MGAYVPIAELAGSIFAYHERQRAFVALKAYLDDSGTHDASDVIVMGGLVATEEAWDAFEPDWQELLTEYGLRKMHMNKLINRPWKSDFRGWSDCKAGRALTRFRRTLIRTRGRMISSGVHRHVWEKVCADTPLGVWFEDPIDFLQVSCLRKALETKRARLLTQERVSVIFDHRLQSLVGWNWMAQGFMRRYSERFAGYSFGRTERILPLQAADMIAYETFRFECDRVRLGAEPKLRPNLRRLTEALGWDIGFFTEAQLRDFVAKVGPHVRGNTRGPRRA